MLPDEACAKQLSSPSKLASFPVAGGRLRLVEVLAAVDTLEKSSYCWIYETVLLPSSGIVWRVGCKNSSQKRNQLATCT